MALRQGLSSVGTRAAISAKGLIALAVITTPPFEEHSPVLIAGIAFSYLRPNSFSTSASFNST